MYYFHPFITKQGDSELTYFGTPVLNAVAASQAPNSCAHGNDRDLRGNQLIRDYIPSVEEF